MAGPRVVIDILGDEDGFIDAADKAKAKIKEITSTVEAMGRGMNAHSAMAVKAFRSEAQEAERALTLLKATKSEHEKLARVVSGVESNVTAAGHKFALATRQMSYGFEAVARTGKLAGEAGRQIISTGAEMALMFGGAGPIVGAVGIAGLAIFNIFDRTRREIEETRKKAEEELQKLLTSGTRMQVDAELNQLHAELERRRKVITDLTGKGLHNAAARQAGAATDRDPTGRSPERNLSVQQLEREITLLGERNALIASGMAVAAQRDKEYADRLDRQNEKLKAQRDLERETAQLREKLLKELFGTDIIGRPLEGKPPSTLGGGGPLKDGGPLQGPGAVVFPAPDIAPFEALRAVLGGVTDALHTMGEEAEKRFGQMRTAGEVARVTLANVANAGIESLIRGGESTAKRLKAAAAEPIVQKLKMKGIEYAKESVGAFAQLNIPQGFALAAASAGAFLGASKVAQLGGIGGGGGGEGGGGAPAGAASGAGLGAQLGAGAREQVVKMEILVVQQTPDGRTIARHTQHVQRLKDLDQPLRVVL